MVNSGPRQGGITGANKGFRGTELGDGQGIAIPRPKGKGSQLSPSKTTKTTKTPKNTLAAHPVGPGKPMTITIEDVWLGNAVRDTRDVLILSSVKDPKEFPSGVQALNWYRAGMTANRFLPNDANEPGTNLVYYSTAVTADSLLITVQIATDHEFDPKVAKKWVAAASGVAGLPAFIGGGVQGQAIVSAVGSGLGIAIDLVQAWLTRPPKNLTWEMNINALGVKNFTGGWVLLTPDTKTVVLNEGGFFKPREAREVELAINGDAYTVSESGELIDKATQERVESDWPYVLLKVHGRPDDSLRKWKPMKLTADLADRFFQTQHGPVEEDVIKALQSFSDVRIASDVAKLDADLKALGKKIAKKPAASTLAKLKAQKEQLEAQRADVIKDVQDAELKKVLEGS